MKQEDNSEWSEGAIKVWSVTAAIRRVDGKVLESFDVLHENVENLTDTPTVYSYPLMIEYADHHRLKDVVIRLQKELRELKQLKEMKHNQNQKLMHELATLHHSVFHVLDDSEQTTNDTVVLQVSHDYNQLCASLDAIEDMVPDFLDDHNAVHAAIKKTFEVG